MVSSSCDISLFFYYILYIFTICIITLHTAFGIKVIGKITEESTVNFLISETGDPEGIREYSNKN